MKVVVAAFNQEKALVGGLLRDYEPSDGTFWSTLCTAHVVLRLMKLCRTRRKVTLQLLQLPGLGWVLTADVVTNVTGQQLCQGTGGGEGVVRAKHATVQGHYSHYVASSQHACTNMQASWLRYRHYDISNRNHARIQEYKMTHHDTRTWLFMHLTHGRSHCTGLLGALPTSSDPTPVNCLPVMWIVWMI